MLHCVTAFTCFCTLCHPYILTIFVENLLFLVCFNFCGVKLLQFVSFRNFGVFTFAVVESQAQ